LAADAKHRGTQSREEAEARRQKALAEFVQARLLAEQQQGGAVEQ